MGDISILHVISVYRALCRTAMGLNERLLVQWKFSTKRRSCTPRHTLEDGHECIAVLARLGRALSVLAGTPLAFHHVLGIATLRRL